MKLRYYMRGLGIGIVVTAILMSVTLDGKTEKLTDAEIIERAEALGMEQKYETTVLADTVSENEMEETEPVAEETGESDMEEVENIQPQEIETDLEDPPSEEDAQVSEEEASGEESDTEEQTPEQEIGETVQITVQGGDGSQTVARKLMEAGLIKDAQAYDRYLCSKGYDKRICTGTHTIPVGATDEEIAKIITSRS